MGVVIRQRNKDTWVSQYHNMGAIRLMYPAIVWSKDFDLQANSVLRLL